jgi:hypothetical protein
MKSILDVFESETPEVVRYMNWCREKGLDWNIINNYYLWKELTNDAQTAETTDPSSSD